MKRVGFGCLPVLVVASYLLLTFDQARATTWTVPAVAKVGEFMVTKVTVNAKTLVQVLGLSALIKHAQYTPTMGLSTASTQLGSTATTLNINNDRITRALSDIAETYLLLKSALEDLIVGSENIFSVSASVLSVEHLQSLHQQVGTLCGQGSNSGPAIVCDPSVTRPLTTISTTLNSKNLGTAAAVQMSTWENDHSHLARGEEILAASFAECYIASQGPQKPQCDPRDFLKNAKKKGYTVRAYLPKNNRGLDKSLSFLDQEVLPPGVTQTNYRSTLPFARPRPMVNNSVWQFSKKGTPICNVHMMAHPNAAFFGNAGPNTLADIIFVFVPVDAASGKELPHSDLKSETITREGQTYTQPTVDEDYRQVYTGAECEEMMQGDPCLDAWTSNINSNLAKYQWGKLYK